MKRLLEVKGKRSVDSFHRNSALAMGQVQDDAERGWLAGSDRAHSQLREEFWQNVTVPGEGETYNQSLERLDGWRTSSSWRTNVPRCARPRRSCGGHFREEHQLPTERDDEKFSDVFAGNWETERNRSYRNRWSLSRCIATRVTSKLRVFS